MNVSDLEQQLLAQAGAQNGKGSGKGNKKPRNRNKKKGDSKEAQQNAGQQGGGWQPPAPAPRNAGKGNQSNRQQPKAQKLDNGAPNSLELGAPPETNNSTAHQSRTSSTTRSQMTNSRFDSLPLHPETLRAIREVLRYETMTKVQHLSIGPSMGPTDIMAKAKTGTGKTLAFLIPSMQKLVERGSQKSYVSVLAISPTRELAQQILDEGQALSKFHDLKWMCVFGGTNIKSDLSSLKKRVPDVLVATPGRLNDLLENHGLQQACSQLQTLIFDEADQLLEMGFRPAITQMLQMLPPKSTRQTLLFSATMPSDITQMARFALRDGYKMVDCVGKEENTHQHVPQTYLVHPLQNQIAELTNVLSEAVAEPGFKVMAFFTTARLTQFFSELMNKMGFSVLEIHSRKSQSHRNKMSEQFRNKSGVIMFTSDVSARGMDYPDVTRVIQVGMPSDKAQYVHRLGRTARAGKSGSGVLLLADFEARFLNNLKDLPITQREATAEQRLAQVNDLVRAACLSVPEETVSMAYQAWMGFYNSNLRMLGWNQQKLVEQANTWAVHCVFQEQPPSLQAKTVGKMGLKGVPGLRIEGKGGVPARADNGGKGGGKGGGGKGKGGGKGAPPPQQSNWQSRPAPQTQRNEPRGRNGQGSWH